MLCANVPLGEPLFAPASATAGEGVGYLLGVAWHLDQHLRSTVRLPVQASPQFQGWWVREDQYPG